MLIAITAKGGELHSPVNGQFERCRTFLFYDTDAREILDVVDNPALGIPDGGAREAAQAIVSHDAEAILTGEIDPEAGDILAAGGVEVYLCANGTVESAIERFMSGDLELRPGDSHGSAPGRAETPHTRPASPGSDPGREEANEEVVGAELECVCPVCGTTLAPEPGLTEADTQRCPNCNSLMLRQYWSE